MSNDPTPSSTASNPTQQQPSSTPTTSKTPVSLQPTTHLDPSAYVRGTHAITLSSNTLIHPRAHLISSHSPLHISSGSIIAEKSIIGGPIPTSTPTDTTEPTEIGTRVHVHPNVQVHAGAKIGAFAVIESNAVVDQGVRVGEHSKVCAGVTVTRDVPDWTVVMGNGLHRRRRRRRISTGEADEIDEIESARLRSMAAEREGTVAVLRRAAARAGPVRAKR